MGVGTKIGHPFLLLVQYSQMLQQVNSLRRYCGAGLAGDIGNGEQSQGGREGGGTAPKWDLTASTEVLFKQLGINPG